MAKHKTLPREGLAVLCSAIKTNGETAENAGTAVSQLSQAMRQGFEEIGAVINDFPIATAFSLPATASAWVLDSEEESDYKWHYDVTAEGVTAADVAIVTIARSGVATAGLCGLCPQNETLTGKIRLRSKFVPASSIAAEYYICPGKEEEQQQEEGGVIMAMGPVNVPAGSGTGGIPIDEGSTVAFKIGCDDNGVYIVTPDETVQGGGE